MKAAARTIDTVDADASAAVESLYLAIVSVGDESPFETIRAALFAGYPSKVTRRLSSGIMAQLARDTKNFSSLQNEFRQASCSRGPGKIRLCGVLKEGHSWTIVDTTEEGYTIVQRDRSFRQLIAGFIGVGTHGGVGRRAVPRGRECYDPG